MAEEYNRDELAQEIERQAAQLAADAAPEAADAAETVSEVPTAQAPAAPAQVADAAPQVLDALEADALEDAAPAHAAHAAAPVAEPPVVPGEDRTQLIEIAPEAAQAMPTQAIDPATQEIPVKVDPTQEMPFAFPEVGSTTRIPEPVVTTEGFDVQAVDVIPDTPAPGEVRDPFAPATAAAAAGVAAASAAGASPAPAVQPAPPQAQPAQPAAPYPPQGYRQSPQGTYADPNFRPSAQPTYATPGYQPTYAQPGAYQGAVQHQPFAPDPTVNPYEQSLTRLSGGMKFGWLVVGLFLGIPGMVIAWLANVDKHPQVKHDAIMFSVIGFVITLVLDIIAIVAFAGIVAATVSSLGAYSGMYF